MPKPDWPTAAPFVPAGADLRRLEQAADGCRGCPLYVVLLGETAGKARLGSSFRVTKSRGVLMPMGDAQALATLHPSAVLRADDRATAGAGLVADLRVAAAAPA